MPDWICEKCGESRSSKQRLQSHQKICNPEKQLTPFQNLKLTIQKQQKQIQILVKCPKIIEQQTQLIKKQGKLIEELQKRVETLEKIPSETKVTIQFFRKNNKSGQEPFSNSNFFWKKQTIYRSIYTFFPGSF